MELITFGYILPLVVTVLLFLFWRKAGKSTDAKRQIPSLSCIPYFINFLKYYAYHFSDSQYYPEPLDYFLPALEGISRIFYKEKIMKFFWGGQTYVACFDSTISENIFTSSVAIEKDWTYNFLHNWLGTGLLTSGGEKWRIRRKMLTPAFHFRILKDFLVIFNEQSNVLVGKLRKLSGQEIDINQTVSLCTLDIIEESAMGIRLRAQEDGNSDYVKAVKDLTPAIIRWFSTPWYWIIPIFNLSSDGRAMRKDLNTVHGFARKVIEGRKATLLQEMENSEAVETFEEDAEDIGVKKRRAFLDLLLYHHVINRNLNMEDIREEVDTFTFEGHDTTSMGISWALYLLGLHEDIQEKVYQEVSRIFGDDQERSLTTEDLKEMKYLECVIKETLRLYPSVPFILRRTTGEIKTGDYIVPANSSVVILIFDIHRDPAVFPNPEVFDPDRFLPENCVGRHPFAYVPFSAGQRNCIGQRFAMMELKAVVSKVVRNFKIRSLDPRDKLVLIGDIILRPKKGLRLILEKR